jgi:hypothetical protein
MYGDTMDDIMKEMEKELKGKKCHIELLETCYNPITRRIEAIMVYEG